MGREKGSGKKLECLECGHCRTKVFESITELLDWCGRKSIKPNKTWVGEVVALGRVRLIWCSKQTSQHSPHGLSPRNASPHHTATLEKILQEEKCAVFVSNQNRNPFISGAWDICPFKI